MLRDKVMSHDPINLLTPNELSRMLDAQDATARAA